MAKYKYAFFDLDGTLTDSAEGIAKSVEYALEKFGIYPQDKSVLRKFMGPPLVDAFMEYFGFSEEDAHKAVSFYRERYRDIGIFENSVYEGIPELLSELTEAGITIIMATSKPEQFAKRIAEHFEFDKYFTYIAGATFDGSRNDKTAVLKYALESVGAADKRAAVMIGDRHHDIEGAANVGIDSIGVLYGYGSREELESEGATHIAESPREIKKFFI